MIQKQINLTLNPNLLKAAQQYTKQFGFKNIQEMATEAIREKVFHKTDCFDNEITAKEQELIELFIDKTLKNKKLLSSEEELDKILG